MFRRVLLWGVDRQVQQCWSSALRGRGFGALWCAPGDGVLGLIDDEEIDVVVLSDRAGPGTDHNHILALTREISQQRSQVRIVVLGPEIDVHRLLRVVRAGAFDYLIEPVTTAELLPAISRATEHAALQVELDASAPAAQFEELIGISQPMLQLYDTIERAAETDVGVLLTGESGTGKELLARALHRRSPRCGGPFVAINCSALPPGLLDSELFGHVRGAFTDARGPRAGLFQAAASGTLFLDEVGDMPLALQPKLLRALQERVVRPLGSDHEVPIDVRIIAATHFDLHEAIASRRFREDLFYRLDVVHIQVPPLRQRDNDVVILARHYLTHYAREMGKSVDAISRPAVERLLAHDWPGNVRELQNCIERAVALTHHHELQVADLPNTVRPTTPASLPPLRTSSLESLEEIERRHILHVLAAVDGNRREAARILEVDRKTLYRRLRRYGVGHEHLDAS